MKGSTSFVEIRRIERKLERFRAISRMSLAEIEGKRGNLKDLETILGLCRSRLETEKGLISNLGLILDLFD